MKISKKLKQFWTLLKTSDNTQQDLEFENKQLLLEIQILNNQINVNKYLIDHKNSIISMWKYISIFLLIYSVIMSLVVIGLINNI